MTDHTLCPIEHPAPPCPEPMRLEMRRAALYQIDQALTALGQLSRAHKEGVIGGKAGRLIGAIAGSLAILRREISEGR